MLHAVHKGDPQHLDVGAFSTAFDLFLSCVQKIKPELLGFSVLQNRVVLCFRSGTPPFVICLQ